MKPLAPIPRTMALILAVALGLPQSAFALRAAQPKGNPAAISDLEEALLASGLEEDVEIDLLRKELEGLKATIQQTYQDFHGESQEKTLLPLRNLFISELPMVISSLEKKDLLRALWYTESFADHLERFWEEITDEEDRLKAPELPRSVSELQLLVNSKRDLNYLRWLRQLRRKFWGLTSQIRTEMERRLRDPSHEEVIQTLSLMDGTVEEREIGLNRAQGYRITPPTPYVETLIESLVSNLVYVPPGVKGTRQSAGSILPLRALRILWFYLDQLPIHSGVRQELLLRVLLARLQVIESNRSDRVWEMRELYNRFLAGGGYFKELDQLLYQLMRQWDQKSASHSQAGLGGGRMVRLLSVALNPAVAEEMGMKSIGTWENIPARNLGDLLGYFEVLGQFPFKEIPPPGHLSRELGFSLDLFQKIRERKIRLIVNGRPWDPPDQLFPDGASIQLVSSRAGLEETLRQSSGGLEETPGANLGTLLLRLYSRGYRKVVREAGRPTPNQVRRFALEYWDPHREKIRADRWEDLVQRLKEEYPDLDLLEKDLAAARRWIQGQVRNFGGYERLLDELKLKEKQKTSAPPASSRGAPSERRKKVSLNQTGREWNRLSNAFVEALIAQAPLGGDQPIGQGTSILIQDYAIGPDHREGRLSNDSDAITLEQLKKRLAFLDLALTVQASPEPPPISIRIGRIYKPGNTAVKIQQQSDQLQILLDRLPQWNLFNSSAAGAFAPATAGLEELEVLDPRAFIQRYEGLLESQDLMNRALFLRRRFENSRRVKGEVWIIPDRSKEGSALSVSQTIPVFVRASENQQSRWLVAVQERLNRETDRLKEVFFEARDYPADGEISQEPAVILRQIGEDLRPQMHLHLPVITLQVLFDVERLTPSWIYTLVVNKALRGEEIALMDVITFQDWEGRTYHALFV